MENLSIEDLRGEIAELEAQAARLSAMRGHLHHQIDFGFETATTRSHWQPRRVRSFLETAAHRVGGWA